MLELQKVLAAQGFFNHVITGYYGPVTEGAVIGFQAAHGIDQLGVVGPATRAALNTLSGNGSSSVTGSTAADMGNMSLSQLQTKAQGLQSELAQVLSRITQLSGQ